MARPLDYGTYTVRATPAIPRRCQSCGGPGAKKHGRRWRCDGCWKFSQPRPQPKVTR